MMERAKRNWPGDSATMKFKQGDLLGTSSTSDSREEPVARVTKVTRAGVVHCVNLVACSNMDEGHEFHFLPDEWTRYYPLPRK